MGYLPSPFREKLVNVPRLEGPFVRQVLCMYHDWTKENPSEKYLGLALLGRIVG